MPPQSSSDLDSNHPQLPDENQNAEIQASHSAEIEAFERDVSSLHHRQQQATRWSWLKRYGWILPVVGLLGAIALRAVSQQQAAKAPETETAPEVTPLSVRTATAQITTLREFISGSGLVQASQFRNLSFDRSGKVTFIASGEDGGVLRAGDRVRKGQLLATIDDRNLQAELQRARAAVIEAQEQVAAQQAQVAAQQAQVAQAQSQEVQAQAQVQEAEAQVRRDRSSLTLAQTELERDESLYADGVIPASNLDTRRNTVASERSNLAASEARVTSAQGQVQAAQSQVKAAQAQVLAAQEQLSATKARVATAETGIVQANVALEDTNLYAPFDGIVSFVNLRLGERYEPSLDGTSQLDPNDATGASTVPIVLVDPTNLEASLALSAEGGDRVEIGQSAYLLKGQNITAASLNVEAFGDLSKLSLVDLAEASGTVVAVTPSVNPGLRTRETTVAVGQGAEKLQHGDRVTAFVATSTVEGAVTVPPNAVVLRDRRPYVFVVVDGMVEQRPVKLGIAGLNEQQVLAGVRAGEKVVTEGQTRLVDETPVRVVGESLVP